VLVRPRKGLQAARIISFSTASAVLVALLAGCVLIFPDAYTSYADLDHLVEEFAPSNVGTVVTDANYADGPGNAVLHRVVILETLEVADDVVQRLKEQGFAPGVPPETNVETTWEMVGADGQTYRARIKLLQPGEGIALDEGSKFYESDDGDVAISFFMSARQ
jgi:hypothetical protein